MMPYSSASRRESVAKAEGGDQALNRTGAVGVGLVNRPIVKHANGDSGIADVDGQQHLQEPG